MNTSDYALLAGATYVESRDKINLIPIPDGFEELTAYAKFNKATGFEAHVYKSPAGEIVIAYAGTNFTENTGEGKVPDLKADGRLGLGQADSQLIEAAALYQEVKQSYDKDKISFTGHSLGGGLAALMGVFFDKKAVTFDPAPFSMAANMQNKDVLLNLWPFDRDLQAFTSNIASPMLLEPALLNAVATNAAAAIAALIAQGHPGIQSIRGEEKISSYATVGEVLSVWTTNFAPLGVRRIGEVQDVAHGDTNAFSLFPVALHSISLLEGFFLSEKFRKLTEQIPNVESHRVSRRLQFLREWRYEEINSLFPRSPRTGRSHGH